MNPNNRSGFEAALIAALARGASPVSDQGFTRTVMRRVRRRRMLRGLVLGAAWVGGGLMATWATAGLLQDFTGLMMDLAGGWREGELGATYQALLAGALAGAVSVAAARLLDD